MQVTLPSRYSAVMITSDSDDKPILMQVYTRLHKLGICMSHKSTVRLLDKLGEGHDAEVHKWKEDLLTHIQLNQVQLTPTLTFIYTHYNLHLIMY